MQMVELKMTMIIDDSPHLTNALYGTISKPLMRQDNHIPYNFKNTTRS